MEETTSEIIEQIKKSTKRYSSYLTVLNLELKANQSEVVDN